MQHASFTISNILIVEVYDTPNNLLRDVQEDLNDIENIAGCRALGVMDKLVTGPYL